MSNTPIVNPLVGTTPDVSATGVSGGGKPTAEQIRTLAAQFESMLLSQMLREMRSSMLDGPSRRTVVPWCRVFHHCTE